MKPISGHPAHVWVPSPPGLGVGAITLSLRVLRVSGCLDIVYIYVADIIERIGFYPGLFYAVFDPPCWRGRKHENSDCAGTRPPPISCFWVFNQVGIYMLFAALPRCRVHVLHVSGCGGDSSHFSLSLLARSFVSLATLLTRIGRYLESIMHYAALWVSLGMPLANFLSPGTDPPLDSPDRPGPIEARLYSIGTFWGYVLCVLLRPLCEYIFI